MAEENARARREQQEEMKEIERSFDKDTASHEEAAAHARGAEEKKESEQKNNSCHARVEPQMANWLRKV
jgi:predicted phage gp36 major capsid-like protein